MVDFNSVFEGGSTGWVDPTLGGDKGLMAEKGLKTNWEIIWKFPDTMRVKGALFQLSTAPEKENCPPSWVRPYSSWDGINWTPVIPGGRDGKGRHVRSYLNNRWRGS